MTEKDLKRAGSKVEMVIADMDGTWWTTKKEISPYTIEVLRTIKEQGKSVTFCTGRIVTMADLYIKLLEIDQPVITANGAVIWDPIKEQVLFERPIKIDNAIEIIEYCKHFEIDCSALTLDACYFTRNSKRKQRFIDYNDMTQKYGRRKIILENFDQHNFCIQNKDRKSVV